MAAEVSASVAAIAPKSKDSPASPRKRRRRAPTTGAVDDCFACQEAQSTCDRRRPYCTQCIDRGKACSGYKTQLTWGVGVASRGKLRGLSLPVAKSKKAVACEQQQQQKSGKRSSVGSTSNKSHLSTDTLKQEKGYASAATTAAGPELPTSTPTPTSFGFINMDMNIHVQSPVSMAPRTTYDWTTPPIPALSNPNNAHISSRRGPRRHSMAPLAVPPSIASPDWGPMPMTAGVFGGFGDAIDSPMTPPYGGPEPMAIPKSYPQSSWAAGSFPESYGSVPSVSSWQSDAISSSLSSETASAGIQEDDMFYTDPSVTDTLDGVLAETRYTHAHDNQFRTSPIKEEPAEEDQDLETISSHHYDSGSLTLSIPTNHSMPSMLVGKTPALRQLINYYDKVIAPVIVAFDGPTNPYRTHILRMAHDSEALQHAIAALSASNLRMRRDSENSPAQLSIADTPHETTHDVSVRKSSIAHNMLRDSISQAEALNEPGQPSQAELYHKKESIKALNMSLARGMDSPAANDDTVLATLLVLCLYHICDTGVAKFKTQFAGVKKLMALRNKPPASSSDIQWLITMFQWFDAMTATVNDREGQFEADHPFVPPPFSASSTDEWSLENLAGCDGRLFKIISQLGRLNLLSQNKPVYPHSSSLIGKPLPPRNPSTDYYSLPSDPPRFDGNGYTALLPDPEPTSSSPRAQFFAEWSSLRQQLLDWRFDPALLPSSMLSTPTASPTSHTHTQGPSMDVHALDCLHISESFRFSALLYTERLAHPTLPSSSANFQSLVCRAMEHIGRVKSDVYLLWPLFITGTECVEEGHRERIRGRCRAIQSDSGFYNNESTLGLLERVWRKKDAGGAEGEGGPFTWRKEMRCEEGEYIVI
ncbi:MAG: hypothetical protein MMC23_007472 [Stictis urceolatum]|nr:hypothetical protein [Stictis urceolata]